MSDNPYSFKIKNDKLYIRYISDRGVEWVFDKLSEGSATLLGKVFTVTEGNNLGEAEDGGEEAEFPIGNKDGQYFIINPSVLGIKNPLIIHETVILKLNPEHFFIRQPYFDRRSGDGSVVGSSMTRYIPLMPKLEKMFIGPIRIGGDMEDSIPLESFLKALSIFPDREEVRRYMDTRISQIFSEYLTPKKNFELYRDNLLKVRQERFKLTNDSSLLNLTRDYRLEIFKSAHDELSKMIENFSGYPESVWQDKIMDIILLLYPKYIHKEKTVKIKTDDSYVIADILLFDAAGCIDLIEIKKPEVNGVGILRKALYRKNYVPSRELSGAIMQIEKYSFWLSRWGKDGEKELLKRYSSKLPIDMKIQIANPVGMIIFGLDDGFTNEEHRDFEIIKRKYKHVVDILTYNDLLRRLKNIIDILS